LFCDIDSSKKTGCSATNNNNVFFNHILKSQWF
jgi:hypothetical protein